MYTPFSTERISGGWGGSNRGGRTNFFVCSCLLFSPLLLSILSSNTNWPFTSYLKTYMHLAFKKMSFSDMQEPDKYSNSPQQIQSLLKTSGASLPFTPTTISLSLSLFFFYKDLQVSLLEHTPSPSPPHLKLFKGLSTWLINAISVPEQRNYFMNIFQFLNFFISSWSTESPHHPNNKFDQFRDVKGPILCLLFYQIQIKNFHNLASQSSMTRQ